MEGEHSGAVLLMFIGALVFIAHLFQAVFQRFRIPDTLFLIGVGLLIGPVFEFLQPDDFGVAGQILTEVALAVILFEAGLELQWRELRSVVGGAVLLTFVVYFSTLCAVALLIYELGGFPLETAIFAGAVIAAPSPPVVIPMLKGLPLGKDLKTMMTLESALGEALGLLVALAVLRVAEIEEPDPGTIVGNILSAFVVAAALGVAFGGGWMLVLRRIREMKNSMILTPAIVFVLFGITEYLGFSGPIASLSFGLVLANAPLMASGEHGDFRIGDRVVHVTGVNQMELTFLGELVFVLKTFFFVFLGLSMSRNDLWTPAAMAAVGVLLVVRTIGIRVSVASKLPDRKTGVLLAAMVPKGLAAAVLAAAGAASPELVGGDEIENLIYSVILYSIIVTAFLVFAVERLGIWRLAGWIFPKKNDS